MPRLPTPANSRSVRASCRRTTPPSSPHSPEATDTLRDAESASPAALAEPKDFTFVQAQRQSTARPEPQRGGARHHRGQSHEPAGDSLLAPYFIIEGAECSASHARGVRMPVVELTRPYPPGPPPESPVYPRCPECGGELGLDEYEADAGLIRCYGFRQTCTACGGTGLWGEREEEDRCPACGGSGHAPRAGCGSLFVDVRDGRAGPVPAFDAL